MAAQEQTAPRGRGVAPPDFADVAALPAFPQVGYGDLYPTGPYSRASQRVPKSVLLCSLRLGRAWALAWGEACGGGASISQPPPPLPLPAPSLGAAPTFLLRPCRAHARPGAPSAFGYGYRLGLADPTPNPRQGFSCLYIMVGVTYVFSVIAKAATIGMNLIELQNMRLVHCCQRMMGINPDVTRARVRLRLRLRDREVGWG